MGDIGGGGEAGGDTGEEAGGLEGLFAGDQSASMKSGHLMSEDELSEYDDLLEEIDEVDEAKKEESKNKKGANVSNKSRGPYKKNLNPLGNNHNYKTSHHQGALTAGKPITAKDLNVSLNDSIMPQSPVVDSFITKQMNHRMSKSLDDMSKKLNIGNNKTKMLIYLMMRNKDGKNSQ